jgi:hypothetical protein
MAVIASCQLLSRGADLDFGDPPPPRPECVAPADCAGTDEPCSRRTCTDGECGVAGLAVGAICDDATGRVCDAAGACVACLEDARCAPNERCSRGACVPPSCTDGLANATEADVDCGGDCPPCDNGRGCEVAADCASGFCELGAATGGAGGSGGAGGGGPAGLCAACRSTSDCGLASGRHCDRSGACAPGKPNGAQCDAAVECTSGFCPLQDGVCCDRACDAQCEACLKIKSGSPTGKCAVLPAGADPDNDCVDEGPASCGATGAGCRGTTAACQLYPKGSTCAPPACAGGVVTSAASCDGAGVCQAGLASGCAPYVCDAAGTACRTDCASDAHCVSGYRCDAAGKCRRTEGAPCTFANECASDACADGVCCDQACTGPCDACNLAGLAGTCAPRPDGAAGDPGCNGYLCNGAAGFCPVSCADDTDCAPTHHCDATKSCLAKKNNGEPCAGANACKTGICADGVCCNTACNGICEACNVAGAAGACTPVPAGTDPADECFKGCCNAGACGSSNCAPGQPCPGGSDECASLSCSAMLLCN